MWWTRATEALAENPRGGGGRGGVLSSAALRPHLPPFLLQKTQPAKASRRKTLNLPTFVERESDLLASAPDHWVGASLQLLGRGHTGRPGVPGAAGDTEMWDSSRKKGPGRQGREHRAGGGGRGLQVPNFCGQKDLTVLSARKGGQGSGGMDGGLGGGRAQAREEGVGTGGAAGCGRNWL